MADFVMSNAFTDVVLGAVVNLDKFGPSATSHHHNHAKLSPRDR